MLVGLAIAVGIAGTLLPILPGLGLIWIAALVFGILEGFGLGGWTAMAIITGLAIAGTVAAIRMPQKAAAAGGISWKGQLLAVALAIVGFFAIPVVGAPVGFVAGVYLVARQQDPTRAWEVTRSTLRSLLVAAGLQFVAAIAMALTWLVWAVAL
ncbi:MAG TPA: DUF456 domain-containing protein [Acidimicrobiia bacterium]|nr:DUF456 domain-containing protein [Acidimicrobiia bacterium]